MGLSLVAGSSQRLRNAAFPVTGYPFSVGCWVKLPNATATGVAIWSLCDTAVTNHYFAMTQNAAALEVVAAAGGAAASAAAASAVQANVWTFVLVRCISAVMRRIVTYNMNGVAAAASNTTSRAPTGIDTFSIGCLESSAPAAFITADVAEFWYTRTDVYPAGADVGPFTHTLMMRGPFAVPHVASAIVEYRSFRTGFSSRSRRGDEVFESGIVPQTWESVNGPTLGVHPPLPGYYAGPRDVRSVLVV